MFGLLAWLWDKASRVYEFFGSLYSKIRDAALSAYSWARQAATDAYTWARNYLIPKITASLEAAKTFARSIYWDVLEFIETVRLTVWEWVLEAKAWAERKARALVQGAFDLIHSVRDTIVRTLDNLIAGVKEWVQGRLAPIFDYIRNQIPFAALLASLVTLFSPDNLSRLVYLLQTGYQWLLDFLEHPIATLWAYIEPYLSDLGSYYLGYALGAVNRTLAPPPNLLSNLVIIGDGGGIGPPPEAGKLASPVSPRPISGNTFGNPAGHYGVDFGISRGQSIFAAHSGTVEVARDLGDGYANCVTIRGGDWWSRYAHLLAFHVAEGDNVDARQVIAAGDSTGNSTGDHLHFEVKYKGSFVNPVKCL